MDNYYFTEDLTMPSYRLHNGDIIFINKKTYKQIKNNSNFKLIYPLFVWFKPKTWFPTTYKLMYIGE